MKKKILMQLRSDVDYLVNENIIDYSFLVGIHNVSSSEELLVNKINPFFKVTNIIF